MADQRTRTMESGRWYWSDKVVIQKYPQKVGFLAIAVYHFLASMVDENQTCYPSQGYIAEKLGCSRWSVNRAIRKLIQSRLITCGKAARRMHTYLLITPQVCTGDTGGVRLGTTDLCEKRDINNNKEQEIDNNIVVSVRKSPTTDEPPLKGGGRETKEELFARDLSEALNDRGHYTIYLSYARQYSESFLRRVLAETKMTPERKIRKSRAALFNYLVYHYAGERN